jgi:Bacterial membrane protein YfhO
MAVAVGAASGWDVVMRANAGDTRLNIRRARVWAVGFAVAVTALTAVAAGACLYLATPTAFRLYEIARNMHSGNPVGAAEFMLMSLPRHASLVMLLALVTAFLLHVSLSNRSDARWTSTAFGLLVIGDLLVRAWPVNPAFDPAYLREPEWLAMTKADPDARFYVGGKRDGTLDATDVHASPGYLNPPGLIGSASRAALSGQTAFYPSAWHGRELLSYDLAVLWPTAFGKTSGQFYGFTSLAARERFLDRAGVRFRVLPATQSSGRDPLVQVPYYVHCYLYDWGSHVTPRASVLPRARIVRHADQQTTALFDPLWDPESVLITHDLAPGGQPAAPIEPFARIVTDTPNRMVLEAGTGAAGGYLLLLDSYSEDWVARVDGQPVDVVRANGLFRAVRLASGRHEVEYIYRPAGVVWGAAASACSLVVVAALMAWPVIRRQRARTASVESGRRRSPASLAGAFAQD